MEFLTRDQILNADDLPYRDEAVPEWGGTVRISTITAADRDTFESMIFDTVDGKPVFKRDNFRAKLLAMCLVDANGKRLFSEGDIEILGRKSAKAVQRLFDIAQELNGTSEAAKEAIEKK